MAIKQTCSVGIKNITEGHVTSGENISETPGRGPRAWTDGESKKMKVKILMILLNKLDGRLVTDENCKHTNK